jgi:hypothetical protein
MSSAIHVNQLVNIRAAGDTYDMVLGVDESAGSSVLKEGNAVVGNNSGNYQKGWAWNGVANINIAIPYLYYGTSFFAAITAAHPADTLWETIQASAITFSGTGAPMFKGDIPDMFLGPVILAQGSRQPATGTVEKVLIGTAFLPFSVIPTM